MIEIKNLSLSLGKKEILKDLSLTFPENKLLIILGENGSGKSTLFNSMLDLKKKMYQGTVLLDGMDIKELSPKEISKTIAFNFQIKPDTDAYVYELLAMARSPFKGFSQKLSKEEEEKIETAVKMSGIESFLDRKMNTLSGGERQMVYIAMTIIQDTKYMVFDEPNTYLDTENQHRLTKILKSLKDEGHTVIVSLHSIDMAFDIGDVIYIMKDGKILSEIPHEEFKEEHMVEEIFHVKKMVLEDDGKTIFIFR